MTKKELNLLEKVYTEEINSAITGGIYAYQTRSKLAEKLCAEGLLKKVTEKIGGQFAVSVKGYQLTLAGNMAYCTSCK